MKRVTEYPALITGEKPDKANPGLFLLRMDEVRRKLKPGRTYMIRHRSCLSGKMEDHTKFGSIIKSNATLIDKYPHGALFMMPGGWREFFTWSELATAIQK